MVLSLVIVLALVYAGFTGQLEINGNAVNRQSKWDIHFENLSNITTTHTAKALTQPRISSATSISDYNVSLTTPGDSISFTFDVVNAGNYNAKITSIDIDTPECTGTDSVSNTNVCSHIHYYLNYDSGASVQVGDTLYAKETNKMKVTLIYDDTVTASELATSDVSISNLELDINFEQDSDALVKDNGEVADYRVYKIGDKITLNNEDYYVIANSGLNEDYVVALKDSPLTVSDINTYKDNLNLTVNNRNGYGAIYYHETNAAADYNNSYIKNIIDNWVANKFISNELKEVDNYYARLIKKDEYESINNNYTWKYSSQYNYWTMSKFNPSNYYAVSTDSGIGYMWYRCFNSSGCTIRPVINIYKSALVDNNE